MPKSSTVPKPQIAVTTATLEDQALDTEGWEIANGNRQSPEMTTDNNFQLDQFCPDVVLKVQPVRESSGKDLLKCQFCLNSYKYLKNLGCQCDACVNCAQRLLAQWRDDGKTEDSYRKTRLCTVCDHEHTMPSLVHTALKPVFEHAGLKCMQCQTKKDTQDAWWCQDCSTILCSKCAHKTHRDHVTVEFDQDYDAIRYCLAMFQLEGQTTATRLKTMTWAKFEEIFKKIESVIDSELELQNKIRRARLTDVFGNRATNTHSQTGDCGYDNLQRRLSVIQQRAVQQYPRVLDEIISLTGLGNKEIAGLKTDAVSEKIVQLLKSAITQLSADEFNITDEQSTYRNDNQESTNETHKGVIYIGEQPEDIERYDTSDKTKRHY